MDPSPSELYSALITGPRRAFVPQPDTKVIDRPGWFQLLTPSFRQGGLNEVHWAILPEDQVAPVVAETIARYQDHQLHWRWTVGPDSGSSGLASELTRVGGKVVELAGMWCRPEPPRTPGRGVTVEPVDANNVELYVAVLAQGWGMDPGPLLDYNRRILAHHQAAHPMFLARRDGTPAAVANATWLDGALHLLGAVVLPEHRGHGLYRALIDVRLGLAWEKGVGLISVRARQESSGPILERRGFRRAFGYPSFHFAPAAQPGKNS